MSDGKTHATATTALVFPVAMTSMLLMPHDPLSGAIIGGLGCLTGLIIDPDLDIENITRSEWQVIKRFWIFGMLWVVFWYPYARAIPHRSPLSHWPLLGTAGRVLYLLLWVAFWYPYARAIPHRSPLSHWPLVGTAGRVLYLLLWIKLLGMILDVPVPIQLIVTNSLFMIWFYGLAVADTAHFIMDVVSSKMKRIRKWV